MELSGLWNIFRLCYILIVENTVPLYGVLCYMNDILGALLVICIYVNLSNHFSHHFSSSVVYCVSPH